MARNAFGMSATALATIQSGAPALIAIDPESHHLGLRRRLEDAEARGVSVMKEKVALRLIFASAASFAAPTSSKLPV
jgi:hypothetical protein